MIRSVASARSLGIWRLAVINQPFVRLYNTKRINLQTNPEYSLAAYIPDSVNEWNQQLNGDLQPTQIPYNYNGFVWWKCPKGEDHIWQSKCISRVDRENKRLLDCPFCSNRRLSTTNSLLTHYPELASEFDMFANNGLKASDIIYTRKKPFFWRCIHNHVYKMTIPKRLEMIENGEQSCPVCRLQDKPSTLLYDYNPELFEESYNWLNCPSLPPPSTEESEDLPLVESDDYLPTDIYKPIDFQELYVQSEGSAYDEYTHSTHSTNPPTAPSSMVERSMRRSLQNHILEYQKWKESLQWNDKRVIWWVCNKNSSHIWRESVRSRVKKYCPFCYKNEIDEELEDENIVTF